MKMKLTEEIAKLSKESNHQDGDSYRSISVESTLKISQIHRCHGRDVEITALEAGIVPERYARNMKTYSHTQQAVLLKSTVSIVGLGGLGGVVVEILARMGTGSLNLIDGDIFEESNLNRQFLSSEKALQQTKAESAEKRINAINSSLIIHTHPEYVNEENAVDYLGKSDVIVDCLGGIQDRFVLEKASKKVGCPLISGAVAGLSGHVTTIFPNDLGLESIYGKPSDLPASGAEASLGCLPQIVTLVAAIQCSEVAKIILNKEVLFRNKIFTIDLLENVFEILDLAG
ncbi:MAG: HesA/MoeB/ThiF family protein [Thermodesulfobacteriota bacterium]|nr:HesA/MoeB/ThiF family protein [Thermodesulfobacteriota bacterium]